MRQGSIGNRQHSGKEFPTTFKVGLYNARMGRPTQLDTSDIAWALLVLRLGILGTLILMVIWIKMISLSSRCSASFGKAVYVYLCISFLYHFAGLTSLEQLLAFYGCSADD